MKLICSAFHKGKFSHTVDFTAIHHPLVQDELDARRLMDRWTSQSLTNSGELGDWLYTNLITERRTAPRRSSLSRRATRDRRI